MIVRNITHTWAVRTDPRLKPLIEQIAAQELLRTSDVVRQLLVEGLQRRGVLKAADLSTGRRTEAAA
jgi:Ribbon-helix-helix protein